MGIDNRLHLLYIIIADFAYVFVCVGPLQKVHDDFKTENDVNNVFDLLKL